MNVVLEWSLLQTDSLDVFISTSFPWLHWILWICFDIKCSLSIMLLLISKSDELEDYCKKNLFSFFSLLHFPSPIILCMEATVTLEISKYDLLNILLKSPSEFSFVLKIKSKGVSWFESTGSSCLSRPIASTFLTPHYVLPTLDNSRDAELTRKQAALYQFPLYIFILESQIGVIWAIRVMATCNGPGI